MPPSRRTSLAPSPARCPSLPRPAPRRSCRASAMVQLGSTRSWTNTSHLPLVSPATRLLALEVNTTQRPSALIGGRTTRSKAEPFAWAPPGPTFTRVVVPVCRSRTNTSCWPSRGRDPGNVPVDVGQFQLLVHRHRSRTALLIGGKVRPVANLLPHATIGRLVPSNAIVDNPALCRSAPCPPSPTFTTSSSGCCGPRSSRGG